MATSAARIGDMHTCPKVTPGTSVPHVGGPVAGPGCLTVLIEGVPATRKGDLCICVGEPDMIVAGSSGVFIGGKPAARMGDRTAHGGVVTSGSGTVFIGEVMGNNFLRKPGPENGETDFKEPNEEEKILLINQALMGCKILLEKKLKLMKNNDYNTLLEFNKWFGKDDEEAKKTILKRIRRVLMVCKKLTAENFDKILDDKDRREDCAHVYNKDKSYRFLLGDPFWQVEMHGNRLRAGVVIHELSHFKYIGNTLDHAYNFDSCLTLAVVDPGSALFNADSFEFFIMY